MRRTSIGLLVALAACSQQDQTNADDAETHSAVEAAPMPSSPVKVYKVSDIEWEYADIAKPYREKVVSGINKVLRENQRCADVQTTSLYPAEGFSKRNPIFFVICEAKSGGKPFGVTFNVNDIGTGKRFAAAPIVNEDEARRQCEEATQRQADGLRNISFPIFTGNFITHEDGRATITLAFAASDRFHLKGDYKVICWFKGDALTSFNIKPA